MIQLGVEQVYKQFIDRFKARGLPLKKVERIAQGRVWDGITAQKLGLVDALGDLDNAFKMAASLGKIDDYKVEIFEQELSTEEFIMQMLFKETFAAMNSVVVC